MRLWSKQLIPALPRKQLLGQWRECCLIAKGIKENGTPNHILVNRVMDYPIEHFVNYTLRVVLECEKRGYRINTGIFTKYFNFDDYKAILTDDIFPEWHNQRYLRQCFYNLQEKRDVNGISQDEWYEILQVVRGVVL